jgi:hypothetical protein
LAWTHAFESVRSSAWGLSGLFRQVFVFGISSGAGTAIPVQFPSDFDNLREHWVKNPIDYLTSVHIANDGGSVVLTARGRAL